PLRSLVFSSSSSSRLLHSFPTRRSSDLRTASTSLSRSLRIFVCASDGKRADLKLVGSRTWSTLIFSSGGRNACGSGLHSVMKLGDRKSTRLNSSHLGISYAVFCLKKKKK